jgi:hypothetical protein
MRLMQMLLDMGKADCEGFDDPEDMPQEPAPTKQ